MVRVEALKAAGFDFISDGESYMNELTEVQASQVHGGVFGCAHTSPYVIKDQMYPNSSSGGICDVNMCCAYESPASGCGVTMSCP